MGYFLINHIILRKYNFHDHKSVATLFDFFFFETTNWNIIAKQKREQNKANRAAHELAQTRQLMSLRSMQGRWKCLMSGREFVLLWWFSLSRQIVFSLYCVELFTLFDSSVYLFSVNNNDEIFNQKDYAGIIGSLRYATDCTRLDIAFAIGMLSRLLASLVKIIGQLLSES